MAGFLLPLLLFLLSLSLFVSWKLAAALLLILLPAILQWWAARLACYAGAAFLLTWAVPMVPDMARTLSSWQSDDALFTSTVFFLCLILLGLIAIAGVAEAWSWVRHRRLSSDVD